MPSRRSVLATAGGALTATLAGCNVLESGGSGGQSDPRRWLTQEVARIPYRDAEVAPVGEAPEHPLLRQVETGRPIRAQAVDGLSEYALDRISSHGDVGEAPTPVDETEELTSIFNHDVQIALGDFDAPQPPTDATEVGSHRGATLYHYQFDGPRVDGFAIADGTYARVLRQRTTDDATAALEAVLNAEAGGGTPIETDGVDRIWSYLEQGFYRVYYAAPGGSGGISFRADGEVVHRRSIMIEPSESEATELATFIEERVANPEPRDGGRRHSMFGPYDDVTVNRDGRVVTVEGSLPASAVAEQEFRPP